MMAGKIRGVATPPPPRVMSHALSCHGKIIRASLCTQKTPFAGPPTKHKITYERTVMNCNRFGSFAERRCYASSVESCSTGSNVESKRRKSRPTTTCSADIIIRGTVPKNGIGIRTGQFSELSKSFSLADCTAFVRIVGDSNPIHVVTKDDADDAASRPSRTKKTIVPGMLTASLFSSIFGTLIPGSIYRSQTISFRAPVYCNDNITGRIDVRRVRKTSSGGLLVFCDTRVWKKVVGCGGADDCDTRTRRQDCVVGEAQVWLPVCSR